MMIKPIEAFQTSVLTITKTQLKRMIMLHLRFRMDNMATLIQWWTCRIKHHTSRYKTIHINIASQTSHHNQTHSHHHPIQVIKTHLLLSTLSLNRNYLRASLWLKPSNLDQDMKATNRMEWGMDRVNFIIKMEACTMATGFTIRCKAMESYTINQVFLLLT